MTVPSGPAAPSATVGAPAAIVTPAAKPRAVPSPRTAAASTGMTTETFLDKLMLAESGGRDDARNPRSTATGPYQFIESTFLDVVRRHFARETVGLTDPQILTLRTDRVFARRAAEAFSRDNAAALAAEGVPATFPNLRLAFLLGPSAAIRVLQAPPEAPLSPLLGAPVLIANPFMIGLTAADLTARATRDLSLPASPIARVALASLGAPPGARPAARRAPTLVVRCNRDLPSCRRWVALQTRVLASRRATGRRGLASAQR